MIDLIIFAAQLGRAFARAAFLILAVASLLLLLGLQETLLG